MNQPGFVEISEFNAEVHITRWRGDTRLFYSEGKRAVVCVKSAGGEAAFVDIGVFADEFIFLCDEAADGDGEGLRVKGSGDVDIGKIHVCIFDRDGRLDG